MATSAEVVADRGAISLSQAVEKALKSADEPLRAEDPVCNL